MAGTYTQIHIQAVFAVKRRQGLIHPSWENDLYSYIGGIFRAKGQKILSINGVDDHIHLFFGMRPTCCLSDLIEDVKKVSSIYINEKIFKGQEKFNWQKGYGAFSYDRSAMHNVINYIENQKSHHHKVSFRDEYLKLLKDFDVDFDEMFIFD